CSGGITGSVSRWCEKRRTHEDGSDARKNESSTGKDGFMDPVKRFFDEWAEFYDADYRDQDIGDVDFYLELAREADGPVLEIGCGTGRVYLELLRADVDAYGIDISQEMLDVLEQKAAEAGLTPHVRQADMRRFEPQREYALVIVPFRTFLHNITLADQQQTLRNLYRALGSDGQLALNFFPPNFEIICDTYGEPQTRVVEQGGDDYTVTTVTELVDDIEQVVEERRTLERNTEVRREATFRLTLVSKREFELLLETTEWSEWTVFGGFDREPVEDATQELVWIAEVSSDDLDVICSNEFGNLSLTKHLDRPIRK
ncbi:MAG: class I SAM-dependent methyltransferase, partial [Halovenus sp.]